MESNKEDTAHRIFKLYKACGFDEIKFKNKFTISDEERKAYNEYYKWYSGIL